MATRRGIVRYQNNNILLIPIVVFACLSSAAAGGSQDDASRELPTTRAADDLEAYAIPGDAVTRELPCRPGFEYSRMVGYFVRKMNENQMVGIRMYRPDGSLYGETLLRDGKEFGVCTTFFPNGQMHTRLPYRDGLLDGPCCQWTAGGTMIGSFSMSMGSGTALGWDDTGHLVSLSARKHGSMDGVTWKWWQNGALMEEESFKDGQENGQSMQYYDNGRLRDSATWKMGKLHGIYHEYGPTGTEQARSPVFYVDGEAVSAAEYASAAQSDPSLPPISKLPGTRP
jgi:antitoxin component YwqK of YwqJK toxin-antitoxin module